MIWIGRMLRRIDDFLLDMLFQPVADAVSAWVSCFGIAAFIYTGFALEHTAFYVYSSDWVDIALTAGWVPLVTYLAYDLDRKPVRDVLSWERFTRFPLRMILLFFLAPISFAYALAPNEDLFTRIENIGWIAILPAEYFMACRKQPPKPKRMTVPARAVMQSV